MAVIEFGHHRTANTETPIVAAFAIPYQFTTTVVGKRPAGIERFVDEIVVNAAMKLIGARSHRDVEQTTARLSIFSREVAGLNRDLLNGFDALLCLSDRTVADGSSSVLAIDAQCRGIACHPVYTNRLIR